MPKDKVRKQLNSTEKGKMATNEKCGYHVGGRLDWSNELVGKPLC